MNTTLKTAALFCATLFVTACGSSGEEMPSIAAANTGKPANTANTAGTANTANTTNAANTASTSNTANTANTSNTGNTSNTANSSNTSGNANTANTGNTARGTTTTPTNNNTSSNTNTAPVAASKAGTAIFGRSMVYLEPFTKISAADFDVITIDGRQITLTNKGTVGTTHTSTTDTDGGRVRMTIASGSNFSYMRFGSTRWTNSNESKAYNYAFGQITPTSGADAVPTSGKATYKGFATMVSYGPQISGEANFDVDFGKKTINGVINHWEVDGGAQNLAGTINGASFSGTKGNVSMEGHFFGPKAAELGGVYKIDYGLNGGLAGAFGAKKQ